MNKIKINKLLLRKSQAQTNMLDNTGEIMMWKKLFSQENFNLDVV